jgi:hypothetical protein
MPDILGSIPHRKSNSYNHLHHIRYENVLLILYTVPARTTTFIDPLEIRFMKDTPHVFNNTVRVKFQMNRPVEKTSCKISGHSKQDCK